MTADRTYIGAIARIDKWDPAHLALKTALETRYQLDDDEANPDQHGAANGGYDCAAHGVHVECSYATHHDRALKELADQGIRPIETLFTKNQVVNTGLTDFNSGLTTAGLATPYNNANASIAMGSSSTAVAVTQTDLQSLAGAANRWDQAMDATYPTLANGVTTWRATIGTANGNFSVQEFAISNDTVNKGTSNTLTRVLNRFLSTPGTKTASQTWQITITLTLA